MLNIVEVEISYLNLSFNVAKCGIVRVGARCKKVCGKVTICGAAALVLNFVQK